MKKQKITDFDPGCFTSDKQRDLYSYWLKIKADHEIPSREDFSPMDIPHVLSSIWMADVIDNGELNFKLRLVGTDIAHAFQHQAASVPLDELSFSGPIIERLIALVETRKPYYFQGVFPLEDTDYNYYSSISLPFSTDGEKVDIIISSVHCYS